MISTNIEQFEATSTIVFEVLKLKGNIYIDVDIVTIQDIQELNRDNLGLDNPTDVLSFPFIDFCDISKAFDKSNYPYEYDTTLQAVNIGSIVICREVAELQSKEYGHSFDREINYLFVHGVLHLLGYDHVDNTSKQIMRELEERILFKCCLVR